MAATKNPRRGTDNNNAKITPEQVRYIRREAAAGRTGAPVQVHGRSSSCSSSWAALQGTSASDLQRLAAVEGVSGQERSGRAAKPVLLADGCGSGADF